MPTLVPFQPAIQHFKGPYFGGPGGVQNIVLPCAAVTTGGEIKLSPPGGVQWFRGYYDQLVVGAFADETPVGDITASISDLPPLPVYNGMAQANGALSKGDYIQLCYDSSLGANGGFHLIDWSRSGANAITLTTLGNSGPATFDGQTLNIPQYSSVSGGTTQIITGAGAVAVLPGDGAVILNKAAPSPTQVNLPSVASRNGLPLIVTDFAGNGGDVTITPNGAETIMGLANAVLTSNGQGVGTAAGIVIYPNTTLNGWYTE